MTAQVKTARKGKTLAALERAAMRLYKRDPVTSAMAGYMKEYDALMRACARHAASKKRKGTK